MAHKDLRPLPSPSKDRKDFIWIEPPGEVNAHAFQVAIAKPDLGIIKLEASVPIEGFSLGNGEVYMVIRSVPTAGSEAGARFAVNAVRGRRDQGHARAGMRPAVAVDAARVIPPDSPRWRARRGEDRPRQ